MMQYYLDNPTHEAVKNMPIQECSPVQKILFGPPGSGKSFRAREIADEVKVETDCTIETTFHPAYDYGDFVAKLLPMTVQLRRKFAVINDENILKYAISTPVAESTIEYRIHVGHLIRAVAKALEVGPEKHVLLILDEINRGDCARIFGDMFQLLDRDASGWSAYGVNLSELSFAALMKALGWTCESSNGVLQWSKDETMWAGQGTPGKIWDETATEKPQQIKSLFGEAPVLRFPPNLSIIGTMNTSDESVYYMDTAFKRRWAFEFLNWNYGATDNPKIESQRGAKLEDMDFTWHAFLLKLNAWIVKCATLRRVDDKQLGLWFLRPRKIGLCKCQAWASGLPNSTDYKEWNSYFGENPPLISPLGPSASQQKIAHGESIEEAILSRFCDGHKALLRTKVTERTKGSERNISCDTHYTTHLALGNKTKDWLIKSIEETPITGISRQDIKNKLMHFLWDNVFSRDRKPLEDLVFGPNEGKLLHTFDEFVGKYEEFIKAIMDWVDPQAPEARKAISSNNS
jgi:5-methylcytosine-specific restriction protein B